MERNQQQMFQFPQVNNRGEWSIVEYDYYLGEELGNGSYGYVKEAVHKNSNIKVAIKMVPNLFIDNIDTKRILREIDLLSRIRNEYVVEMLDIVFDHRNPYFDTIFLIFEWAPCDLKKLFFTPCFIKNEDMEKIMYKILCGLNYIHSCSVLHRDLKPSNILLQDNYAIKICDFGLARSVLSESDPIGNPDDSMNKNNVNNSETNKSAAVSKGKGILGKYSKKKDPNANKAESKNNNMETQQTTDTSTNSNSSSNDNFKPKELKQVLSHHVVTRWYRAPELILIQNNYTSAIDVWSLGCIFGELMTLLKDNCVSPYERKPLFPGRSCFPLSPPKDQSCIPKTNHGYPVDYRDQLNLIFDVIGTPSDEDMSFITDQHAKEYLNSFKKINKKNLKERFNGSTDESLDLLSKMIEFNPNKRITVKECFEHPFFINVRNPNMEKTSNFTLNLDYENLELSLEELRNRFIEVITKFKIGRGLIYANQYYNDQSVQMNIDQ